MCSNQFFIGWTEFDGLIDISRYVITIVQLSLILFKARESHLFFEMCSTTRDLRGHRQSKENPRYLADKIPNLLFIISLLKSSLRWRIICHRNLRCTDLKSQIMDHPLNIFIHFSNWVVFDVLMPRNDCCDSNAYRRSRRPQIRRSK